LPHLCHTFAAPLPHLCHTFSTLLLTFASLLPHFCRPFATHLLGNMPQPYHTLILQPLL
jgi:hypothetical protein